ncbi:MAG: acetyl-CoA carboxylase carboxyltransferase subunit alpha [Deltaproteobacteria bacterium]|nr:acetyl-CoA carboxylase carboxyltransferase subunit alpha [Deltaproteobacteria bacterium]
MNGHLDFEHPIVELERRIEELRLRGMDGAVGREVKQLEERVRDLATKIMANLTPWQRVQLSRHSRRPYFLDYLPHLADEFVELHGDRRFGDDAAIVGGLARMASTRVVLIGTQKGRGTQENVKRSFGMARPEGYRKALRLFDLAARFKLPVVTLVDTPGAYPGVEAEARGQALAIAENLLKLAEVPVPVVTAIVGEGGSGGALALAVANRVLILEYAIYSVISPEGCAAILWKDGAMAPEAAGALKLTSRDLLRLRVVDEVIPEPLGGAHKDTETTARTLKATILRHLHELESLPPGEVVRQRHDRFRGLGVFEG